MDEIDFQLIKAIQNGLPICLRPYQHIASELNLSEQQVIDRLTDLRQKGLLKRLGVIVNHRQLGYRANAMIVINIPDQIIDPMGVEISQFSFVNLCYQRPRQGEQWPYNLYFMIHGKTKERVLEQLDYVLERCGLKHIPKEILFSKQCFKQRGALYKQAAEQVLEKDYETVE